MNINADEVKEIFPGKIYYANFSDDSDDIPVFAKALKDNGIKCLITIGSGILFQDIVDLIRQLPDEYKNKIKADLEFKENRRNIMFDDAVIPDGNKINPVAHENQK